MNFELDAEQYALRDSLERMLRDHFDFQERQRFCQEDRRFPEALWQQYVELGLTALWVPEEHGGFNGGAADLFAVLPTLGQALTLDPLRDAGVLASVALRQAEFKEPFYPMLEALAAGQLRLAWAHDDGSHGVAASLAGSTWQLNGTKPCVAFADSAHGYLVTAKLSETVGCDAPTVFYVPAGVAGLAERFGRLVDDTPASTLLFENTSAQPLWSPGGGTANAAWQEVERWGIAATAIEMLGVVQGAFELVREYVTVRSQFGHKMSEHQAVRHHVADMSVSLELCRSMAMAAAVACTQRDNTLLWQSKYLLGEYGRRVCHLAIQLHGGIGMTEEHKVGHYLRRLHVLDQRFGSRDVLVERLTTLENHL